MGSRRKKLVKPFSTEPCDNDCDDDDERAKREFSAESINIVISQCGLVSLGIGSVRYDVFQDYTIPSRNNVSHLKLDTKESICQRLQLYENEQ
jgi:hypothetical protein